MIPALAGDLLHADDRALGAQYLPLDSHASMGKKITPHGSRRRFHS
jgi:hypothetical protein